MIKELCVRCHISIAELERRMGITHQTFNSKMKCETFNIWQKQWGVLLERYFVLLD